MTRRRGSFTSNPCCWRRFLVEWCRKRTNVFGASCSCFVVLPRCSARTLVPSAAYPPDFLIVYDRYVRWDPLPGTATLSLVPAFTKVFVKKLFRLSIKVPKSNKVEYYKIYFFFFCK